MNENSDPSSEYQVGYKKPPIEHRFKKGISGNPKGRPHSSPPLSTTMIDGKQAVGLEERSKTLAIEEGYRLVTVREGDRAERIPLLQAILRKMMISAVNGNTRAQRTILTLIMGAEADRRAAATMLLAQAIEYKEYWSDHLAKNRRDGIRAEKPIPHPDDVIIDYETGDVHIGGPVLKEQKLKLGQKGVRNINKR